jgi:hypothetical protein
LRAAIGEEAWGIAKRLAEAEELASE